ncbi:MAG: sulfite exporter TauE/SafE family protein [Candidatus Nanopelagicales bacterium]|nr:sulfite exporter TauE/SafE family protein [Candidatus Nanopelagicales bacterium]
MSARADSDELQRRTVPVVGMTCDACEKRVGRALLRIPGVESVDVSARRGTAVLRGAPLPPTDRVEAAIRSAGYEPGTPAWLTSEASTWITVALSGLAIVAVVFLAGALGVGGLVGDLASPSRGGLLLVLVLGLTAGFSTCMAMVGGLVLGFSASHAAARTRDGQPLASFVTRMRPQVAFNVGRIVGFGVLGAALGSLGSVVGLPTRMIGALALAVAVVMFLLGVRLTGVSPRMAAWSPRLPAGLAGLLGLDAAAGRPYSHTRTALVGAATFFLPCGFTQAVQVYALSTGSPASAGLIMATFAVGTTPGLLAVASVPEIATGRSRGTVLQVVGVVVLAFALLNVTSGLRLLGIAGATATAATAQQVSNNVTVTGGVQTVHMTQTRDGYTPADTVIHAGMPITWSIQATSKWECSAFLRVPDLDISVDLQEGLNTIELPALPPGVVPFTCVMGMYSGNLIAIDPPAQS